MSKLKILLSKIALLCFLYLYIILEKIA